MTWKINRTVYNHNALHFFFFCIARSKNVKGPMAWQNVLKASHNPWPLIGWTSGRWTRHRSVSWHTGACAGRPWLTSPEGCLNQREGGIQKKEAGRSSPETPGAPSQQAGAVGTRTRASIMRASPTPTYVDELREDVAAENTGDLASCMEDQEDWKRQWRSRPRA